MFHGIGRIVQMICAAFFFERQPSILHGGFPFCLITEALWNLNLLTSSFTSWSLHQHKETKMGKTKARNNKKQLEGMGGGAASMHHNNSPGL